MPADDLKRAEQALMTATELDVPEPLKAAERYVEAIRLLRTAGSVEGLEAKDQARIQKLLDSAMDRFQDCERRVKEIKDKEESSAPQKPLPPVPQPSGSASWISSMTARLWGSAQPTAKSPEIQLFTLNAELPTLRRDQASTVSRSQDVAKERGVARGGAPHGAQTMSAPQATRPGEPPSSASGSSTKSVKEAFKGVDKNLAKSILDEVLDSSPGVRFDDIAGLKDAKAALQEAIILPSKRPDLFVGIRSPPKGILLFGPPGTGKTLLAKAVATESNCKFFSLSASSLTSKWVGQAEKMVKALFAVAAQLEPCVLFIDEVDSVLSSRSENEHEASRRLKTEFLVQFDGVSTASESRVIVVAATNRPQELDEAVRRRFTKRLFIPLPAKEGRLQLMKNMLKDQKVKLQERQLGMVAESTEGFSGSDLAAMCRDAAMAPIRELGSKIETVDAERVRGISYNDLVAASKSTRPSVSQGQLQELQKWNKEFGTYS